MANTQKKPVGRYLRKHTRRGRQATLVAALALILVFAVGATAAFLLTKTSSVTNTFTPSQVSCSVTEDFDGTTKSNVNVTNTSDIPAYIRVKLVTYRVNDASQRIGGTATIPAFTPGENWVKNGEYYYYTLPVAAGDHPANPLIGTPGIELAGSYPDADGGKQVIEVMAEAIQSTPAEAVGEAWGVSISQGAVSVYSAG